MSQSISGITNQKLGNCPHGLPAGACPICNGKGGGGATRTNNSRKPGEMTWSQCFAAGQMMKMAQDKIDARQNNPLYNLKLADEVRYNIENYINNVQKSITAFQNILPPALAKIVNVLNQTIITPMLNLLAQLPRLIQFVQNGLENLRNIIMHVSEKLTAFFGEIKNFINKKSSDFVKALKKKIFNLFSLTFQDKDDSEDEEFLEVLRSNKN